MGSRWKNGSPGKTWLGGPAVRGGMADERKAPRSPWTTCVGCGERIPKNVALGQSRHATRINTGRIHGENGVRDGKPWPPRITLRDWVCSPVCQDALDVEHALATGSGDLESMASTPTEIVAMICRELGTEEPT